MEKALNTDNKVSTTVTNELEPVVGNIDNQIQQISEEDFYNSLDEDFEGISLLQAHTEIHRVRHNSPVKIQRELYVNRSEIEDRYERKIYVSQQIDSYDDIDVNIIQKEYNEEMRLYTIAKEKYEAEMYAIEIAKYNKAKEEYDAYIANRANSALKYLKEQREYEEKLQRYKDDKKKYDLATKNTIE